MTGAAAPGALQFGFRGAVVCRRAAHALTLSGFAKDSAEDLLILTFLAHWVPELPASLSAATVSALDERCWRIACASGDWVVEATSVHVHRAIGDAFYRAIPPRPAPLAKRLFWRAVMALAGSWAGERVLRSGR